MRSWVTALAVAASLLFAPPPAAAQDDSAPPATAPDDSARPAVRARPVHLDAAVGGYLAITGPVTNGGVVEGELYPGGRWGRFGIRAELRGRETEPDLGQLVLGVTYEAAATRPRLQLALHADGGLSFPDHRPVIGGGLQVRLGLFGPFALGADSTAFLIVDGMDSTLVVASALTARLGF